ncbi:MAG: DUF4468 domain-containing protein [Bacteroidaceae bacterium]|jgi:hypothetical protein|nr:DUF4468 domain-containing protein [Bacteroidaceae bacterium]
MKKIILSLLLVAALPFCANAQKITYFGKAKIMACQEASYYMQGAVKEVDGKVVFTETIELPGKSKDEIYNHLLQWVSLRFMPNSENGVWYERSYYKNRDYASIVSNDKNAGKMTIKADEEWVFSNKTLAKDFTRAFYNLDFSVSDGKVEMNMYNIFFDYEASNNERMIAEEWITDAEAITKDGAGLHRRFGKFRVKTIDVKDELIAEIKAAVNDKQ